MVSKNISNAFDQIILKTILKTIIFSSPYCRFHFPQYFPYFIFVQFQTDSVNMAAQPAVGVIPLGTGNDLARCLRWGGGYEGESIPKIMDKISTASTVMLDRWSIEVTNHAPAEQFPKPKVLKVNQSINVNNLNHQS